MTNKKGLMNWAKGFLRIFENNSPYHEENKLEVAKTKQVSKKIHDSRYLLLINVEDPCQYTYFRNLEKKTLIGMAIR